MGTTMQDRDLLTSYLADRDVPCPRCGYNLRNLQADRCPECGRELFLELGLARIKLAALVVGLIGLCGGVGFDALMLLAIALSFIGGKRYGFLPYFLAGGIGLIVEGGLLLLGLSAWRKLNRRSAVERWTLATGAWGLSAANIFVISSIPVY